MKRFLRLLMMVLLVASLPLRGYAAASMQPGAGAHGATQADPEHVAHAQDAVGPPAAMHDPSAAHAHAGMHDHAALHTASTDDMDASPGQAAKHHSHGADALAASSSCSYCGDCCSAGALQSAPLTLGGNPVVTRVESLPLLAPASFVADLPVPPPNRYAA